MLLRFFVSVPTESLSEVLGYLEGRSGVKVVPIGGEQPGSEDFDEVVDLFSARTYNCLKNEKLLTLEAIAKKGVPEFLRMKNLGRKSLKEIKEVLKQRGIHLAGEPE